MRLPFRLEAEAAGSRARAGVLTTLHGEVQTPVFMPVGTQATVKAQTVDSLRAAGSRILLANTYHLLLRPGPEVFERMGGIHRFMRWDGAVLTDSGGYQIFSLPNARSMTEEGAVFRSYVDGRNVLLSPEVSIRTQLAIGSDIMMALDECVPSTADLATARRALDLTHRWAERSLAARGDAPSALFGIVQGALFPELREESVERIAALPFDGLAIGGLAVGEGRSEREDTCELTAQRLPREKPRYLMGVGTPIDLLEAVHRGIDMFDCIIPTQLGGRGGVFTSRGYLQLRRTVYRFDERPPDPACPCPTCATYSRAYLHHLTKTQEVLGWHLLGQHNLHFYHRLMRDVRAAIADGTFAAFYAANREPLAADDQDHPTVPLAPRPRRVKRLGAYEVHVSREGFSSVRHVASGEIMHGRVPPLEEAEKLYVEQSDLAQRLSAGPVVVWDVGLGAAANAMAAIRCAEHTPSAHALTLVSFENDLDPLRLAFKHRQEFQYLRHAGPSGILARGAWDRGHVSWQLLEGDFLQRLADGPPPDLVFYDPFSSRTHGEAWTLAAFTRLREALGGRAVELFTYSNSTAVRTAMLAAGFFVAQGRATGEKTESTIAVTVPAASRHELLGPDWLERWKRSGSRYPSDVTPSPEFDARILGHPQFGRARQP